MIPKSQADKTCKMLIKGLSHCNKNLEPNKYTTLLAWHLIHLTNFTQKTN